MIFKNVQQLKSRLRVEPTLHYQFNPGVLTDQKALLKSTMNVENSKIFYIESAHDVVRKMGELYDDPEAVEVIKSFNDVSQLPFDEITYVIKLTPTKPIIGEVNVSRPITSHVIVSICRVRPDVLGVSIFADSGEDAKREKLPERLRHSDKITANLDFMLQETYMLYGTHGSVSTRVVAYLKRPVHIVGGVKLSDRMNDLIVTILSLTMYYNAKPAVEVGSAGTGGGHKASSSNGAGSYVIDYSKPRIKYTDLPKPKGTHASPREHVRGAHIRRYKSGKVVSIPERVINKGNGTPIVKQYKL